MILRAFASCPMYPLTNKNDDPPNNTEKYHANGQKKQ